MTKVAIAVKEAKILQDRLDKKLKSRESLNKATIKSIEKEGKFLTDFIAPLGNSDFGVGDKRAVSFISKEDRVQAKLKKSTGRASTLNIHPHAVRQTAERFGIPTRYAKELAYSNNEWERNLVTHMLNEHSLNTHRKKALIRTVGGEIRGVLSDKYRRLDTPMIYGSFFEAVNAVGGKVVDVNVDDTRSWVEVLRPTVIPIETENNGTTVMAFGARISNSDFGDGSLTLSAYNMQVICLNGMVGKNTMKQIHLGRQIPDDITLSEQTYLLDSQTQASLVKDAVSQLLSKDSIMEHGRLVQKASGILIEDVVTEIPRLKDLGVLKKETETIMQKMSDNNPDEGITGRNTVWKLSQAINATANTLEDSRRRRDLEEIAGAFVLNKTKGK